MHRKGLKISLIEDRSSSEYCRSLGRQLNGVHSQTLNQDTRKGNVSPASVQNITKVILALNTLTISKSQ